MWNQNPRPVFSLFLVMLLCIAIMGCVQILRETMVLLDWRGNQNVCLEQMNGSFFFLLVAMLCNFSFLSLFPPLFVFFPFFLLLFVCFVSSIGIGPKGIPFNSWFYWIPILAPKINSRPDNCNNERNGGGGKWGCPLVQFLACEIDFGPNFSVFLFLIPIFAFP